MAPELTLWERIIWDSRRLYYQAKKGILRLRIGRHWVPDMEGFEHRRYPDYGTYVAHQKTKFSALRSKSVEGHDQRFYTALSRRLERADFDWRGRSVLCLAARQGTEVRAFIDQGAFAVGLDLNPGPSSRYVVTGDFHALQFSDGSIDCVYTNSLDHAFELKRILEEVRRVLRPEGLFIVEANADSESGAADRGPFEAMVWGSVDILLAQIEDAGFRLTSESDFDSPWRGRQVVLRVI